MQVPRKSQEGNDTFILGIQYTGVLSKEAEGPATITTSIVAIRDLYVLYVHYVTLAFQCLMLSRRCCALDVLQEKIETYSAPLIHMQQM